MTDISNIARRRHLQSAGDASLLHGTTPMAKQPFRELITSFLHRKLMELERRYGRDSDPYLALARQYVRTDDEDVPTEEANLRHYDADLPLNGAGLRLPGVERLYRRTLVIEPTLACAAHCRFCIRANYPRQNLSERDLRKIAEYCGAGTNRDDLREVLVTGGDPLLVPHRVDYLLRALAECAPNIRVVRIATRVPLQDPRLVTHDVLRLFEGRGALRVELATQINHSVELFPEAIEALRQIMNRGTLIYAQNVLLHGINDNLPALVSLYDALRDLGIEAHYLFHCVPLQGMSHLRTSLRRAIDLVKDLTCSGSVSGRAKPMLAAMTDVGKIVLYEGTVLRRKDRHVLLQSRYRLEDRLRWNPAWHLPPTVEVGADGCLCVWYMDGQEVPASNPQVRRPHPTVVAGHRAGMPLPVLQSADVRM